MSPPFSGKILPQVLRRAHNIPGPSQPKVSCAEVWESVEDIEQTLVGTCKALQEIQRQIQKGEETYFEETTSHANIFKGWDAFLDVRLEAPAAVTQVRRMPADYKWMSSSSVGIPRYYALPHVSLESALEKKREIADKAHEEETSKKMSTEDVSSQGEIGKVEKAGGADRRSDARESETDSKPDGKEGSKKTDATPTMKRKDRTQEETESQNEEPTPTPRRTKRSKRSAG